MNKFKRQEIAVNGNKIEVVHNLPDTPGLSFEDAVPNWALRTTKYTPDSLCDYINEKMINIGEDKTVALTIDDIIDNFISKMNENIDKKKKSHLPR